MAGLRGKTTSSFMRCSNCLPKWLQRMTFPPASDIPVTLHPGQLCVSSPTRRVLPSLLGVSVDHFCLSLQFFNGKKLLSILVGSFPPTCVILFGEESVQIFCYCGHKKSIYMFCEYCLNVVFCVRIVCPSATLTACIQCPVLIDDVSLVASVCLCFLSVTLTAASHSLNPVSSLEKTFTFWGHLCLSPGIFLCLF